MKFMVIVNQKYLVMVEAQTTGGAEHRILDDIYYGIETCLAFSMQELGTETFAALASNCQTISFAELKEKADAYKETLEEIATIKDKMVEYSAFIEKYENAIHEAKTNASICKNNLYMREQELKEII